MFYKDQLFVKQLVKKVKMIFLLLLLLTFIPSLSLADESEAYEHEYEVMDKCNNSFYVYANQDEGCNHYYPSGKMGDISSITFDSSWTSNCYSGTSCIKIAFSAKVGNWAGIHWQDPENNWGTVPNAGYDLTEATKLTFWAKGDNGGEKIEFFVGGITGPYPDSLPKTSTGYITLTSSWQKYTINLISKDLSYVIGGFGWATNSSNNPGGATFYLDEIKYDKARPDELRFLGSYETLPLEDPDQKIRNSSFVYDNALALLTFLARGNIDDLRRAKIIADAFITVKNNDRYYTDGRLRNAYMSGDLTDHLTGKARLPGWWNPDINDWDEDPFQVSTHTGNIAWTIIALLNYYKKMGGDKYLTASMELGDWIERETRDTKCEGGYTGGYEGPEPNPQKLTNKSTEHNIDLYVAFTLLYEITGDTIWNGRALHAKEFVEAMWNTTDKHFWTGTLNDGCTIEYNNIPVDIQAWGLMSMDSYNSALIWAENNCYTEADGFKGFDFNNDNDGVWFEGTAQMAVAYQVNDEKSKSDFYIDELIEAQTAAPNTNGKGIVAASHDGVTTGFDWEYFSRLHIGATAWYIFAEMEYNPYWGIRTTLPIPDIKANGSDGPVSIPVGENLSVRIELDPGIYAGYQADWWCVADAPFGWYYYDAATEDWLPGFKVSYQGPLGEVSPPLEVLNTSDLPLGSYTFYLGVDGNRNGNLDDPLYYDSVEVSIVPQDGGRGNDTCYDAEGTPIENCEVFIPKDSTALEAEEYDDLEMENEDDSYGQ